MERMGWGRRNKPLHAGNDNEEVVASSRVAIRREEAVRKGSATYDSGYAIIVAPGIWFPGAAILCEGV